MAENVAVSVLMPVYNAGATVERAVESILGQREVPSLELVAVDDGSTDGTSGVLASLAARDSRLKVTRIPHGGLVQALIAGRELCRGSFIARMDADDLAHPFRLKAQLDLMLGDPALGLVGTQVRIFPRHDVREGLLLYESWLNGLLDCPEASAGRGRKGDRLSKASTPEVHRRIVRELFVECPLAHPTFLLRKEAFDQAGGYRDYRNWPEDYDLVMRVLEAGWRLGGVARPLLFWRDYSGRAFRSDPRYAPESFRSLKLHYLLKMRLAGGKQPVSICGAGPVGKQWLKDLQAAGIEVRYLAEVNPRKIGKSIHGVPVVDTRDLPRLDDPGLVLGAVGQRGGRSSVRASLNPLGYLEGEDYLFVA